MQHWQLQKEAMADLSLCLLMVKNLKLINGGLLECHQKGASNETHFIRTLAFFLINCGYPRPPTQASPCARGVRGAMRGVVRGGGEPSMPTPLECANFNTILAA